MSDPFNVPPVPEQDQSGGDVLPTYDDLAQQHGPNSRFGRWREWIEKRAAERYNDLSPADFERRRQRGWGEGLDRQQPGHPQVESPQDASLPTVSVYAPSAHSSSDASSHPLSMYSTGPLPYGPSSYPAYPVSMYSTAPYMSQPAAMYPNPPASYSLAPPLPLHPQLRLQTSFTDSMPSPFAHANYPPPPQTLIPESLDPSHLKLYNFGSRFLPHTTYPIRCLLPVNNHRLLLIGHDDGLSVLDMFPSDWTGADETQKGPPDAQAKLIWEGEGVHQMSILESESIGEGTPQGVVLALVSTEDTSSKESENTRVLRMYNLGSLISLAKYYATQKGARPLDLRSTGKSSQSSGKKTHHRPPSSITKGLRNLVLDNGIAQPQTPSTRHPEPQASYSSITDSWTSPGKSKAKAKAASTPPSRTDSTDSEWDMVNELPLRWATNYTPLASSGSRLQNNSVLLYDVWRNEGQRGPGGVLLAIATKSSILLYEAPKGERAFRFTKEFYTPLPARSISFIHQSVQDNMSRSPSDVFPRTAPLDSAPQRHMRVSSFGANVRAYPTQLSLFVVFEKKAGTIRVADAAVGEVELYEDNWSAQQTALMSAPSVSSLSSRRSRASWDGRGFSKDKGMWARPVRFDVPGPSGRTAFSQMYVLTRGRQSHIIPHPLPAKVSAVPPFRILYWTSTPTHVTVRIGSPDDLDEPPMLQIVAFGEDGVEVQEVPLSQLSERKGKGRAQDPVRTQADVGGSAGLLLAGGHWHRPFYQGGLQRSYSTSSTNTYDSSTAEDEESERRARRGEGVYGWAQRGAEDYRVFWLGDASNDDDGFDDFE